MAGYDYEPNVCENTKPTLKELAAKHLNIKNSNEKLVDAHWEYVKMVLTAHGEESSVIKACESAYKLGMSLGLAGDSRSYGQIVAMMAEKIMPGANSTKIRVHCKTRQGSSLSNPKRHNIGGEMEWATFDSFDRVAKCPNCGTLVGKGSKLERQSNNVKTRYHSCPSCRIKFRSMETR